MPNIKQFDTPALDIRPSEVGVEATAAAGRRLGGFFNQSAEALSNMGQRIGSTIKDVGDVYVNYKDHQQVSAGAATGAVMFNDLNNQKDELIKAIDPNDALYGQKVEAAIGEWREKTLEPRLATWREGFTTENSQKWAEHFIDRTRQHFFTQTSADISNAAGIGIKNSIRTTLNASSNTVYKNPLLLDDTIDLFDHSVTGAVATSPIKGVASAHLRSDILEKGKEQLVKSAVMGAIRDGGDWQSIANDKRYSKYINAAELEKFAKDAKSQQRADFLQQKEVENYQRKQNVQHGLDELGDLDTKAITRDESGRATVKPNLYKDANEIARKYEGLHEVAEKAQVLQRYGESLQREKRETIISDPETRTRLYNGLFKGDDTATTEVDIQREAALHKLDDHDTSKLLNLHKALEQAPLKGPRYTSAIKAAEERLGVTVVPDGHQRFSNFMEAFMPEYLRQKAAGTLPPNALSMSDEKSLIRQAMKEHEPTPNQMMVGRMEKRFGMTVDPELINAPTKPAQRVNHPPMPASLANNPNVAWSPSKGRWIDVNTRQSYDKDGKGIK